MRALIDEFISRHALPAHYRDTAERHVLPLADWIAACLEPGATLILGINGAQGTGKSTLALLLQRLLESRGNLRIALLSIDDFYLTLAERERLAANVHPLLRTRGVPGTHDVALLQQTLERLALLAAGQATSLPRFDKGRDDRDDAAHWGRVNGPVDLVILEGWCVGSVPQPAGELLVPLNSLEREEDADAAWRRYVNDQLGAAYASVFSLLGKLVFLQAPDFASVERWRLQQEEQLQQGSAVMSAAQIARFVLYFERLTRANLQQMPGAADVVLELDRDHRCVASYYRGRAA